MFTKKCLEIGPGLGALTDEILDRNQIVYTLSRKILI